MMRNEVDNLFKFNIRFLSRPACCSISDKLRVVEELKSGLASSMVPSGERSK